MESFQLFHSDSQIFHQDIKMTNQLLDIYISHNINLINKSLEENHSFSRNHKFVFLLISLIWEDSVLLKKLLTIFQIDYKSELGLNINLTISFLYSKEIQKLYEMTTLESFHNEEYDLLKEIIATSGHPIIFSEKCLISIIEQLKFEEIYNLINLRIHYYPEFGFGSFRISNNLKLEDKELLKLISRSKISIIFLYNFSCCYYKKKVIIKAMIKARKNSIAQIILNSKINNIKFIEKSLKIAAKYMNFKILFKNHTSFVIKEDISFELKQMMNYLIFNFDNSISYIDFRIYLISSFSNHFSVEQSNHILIKLYYLISTNEDEKNILLFVANPIKTLILIHELSTKINKKYKIFEGISIECNTFIINKCHTILSSIKSLRELAIILEDKLFEEKNICEYIYTNKLLSIMKNPYFHMYIQNYWDCSVNYSYTPLTFSSSLKIISGDCLSNPCFEIHKYAFLSPKYLKGSYVDYVKNPSTKFIYQLLFDCLIGIFLFFYIFKLNDRVSNIKKFISNFIDDQNKSIGINY